PYIDLLPVWFAPGSDVRAGVAAFAEAAVTHPPAAPLRALVSREDGRPRAAFDGAVQALAAPPSGALVGLPVEPAAAETVARAVAGLQSRIGSGFAPAPAGGLGLRAPSGGPSEGAHIAGRF